MKKQATVVGGGLAGCEAAWQLAKRGVSVDLMEMKPQKRSPAHKMDDLCELVCSNSLRSDRVENAVGLLKAELRLLDSLIMACADATSVPAGGALAVDRDRFSALITEKIRSHPNITLHTGEEVCSIPDAPCIIATGPLTTDALSEKISALVGQQLHFYDAAAPIVTYESLDLTRVCRGSRYGRGEDYLNCPLTRQEYFDFYRALITAKTAPLHDFETPRVFEGCMPVEAMAKRGEMTLCYGPLKPVGLDQMRPILDSGSQDRRPKPFAVVQLRQDNGEGTLFNLVGFQTNLTFGEQKRVFGMIPGLEKAEYARYGVMHRNTFLPSPGILGWDYQLKSRPGTYFAGQMTGVEGYVESAASGWLAGLELARALCGMEPMDFTAKTALGALGHYVAEYNGGDFQPMNITFGIMDSLPERIRDKQARYRAIAERSVKIVKELKTSCL